MKAGALWCSQSTPGGSIMSAIAALIRMARSRNRFATPPSLVGVSLPFVTAAACHGTRQTRFRMDKPFPHMGSYFLPARVIGRVAFPIIASVRNFSPDHVCAASAHPIAPLSGTTHVPPISFRGWH
jgi:hypothetical protein